MASTQFEETTKDRNAPRNPARRRLLLAGFGALFGGVPLYASLIEPTWLDITRHEVPLPGLPDDLDGLRVAQLSDLHRGRDVDEARIAEAVAACNRLRPDVVALTGDFVSDAWFYSSSCARALSALYAPRGVYAVPGNHDNWHNIARVSQPLARAGIKFLTNTNTRPVPGLMLAGVDDVWTGHVDLDRALAGRRRDEGLVLLSHSPVILSIGAEQIGEGLCLAGHTHGGQICLPPIPRRLLPGLGGSPYVSGWYSRGRCRMYVNRGIGTVFLPIRFLCRPELSLFVLRAPALP